MDKSFTLKDRQCIPFPPLDDFSDNSLLISWNTVLELVISILAQTDERALIFQTKGHLNLFHIVKSKLGHHTKSTGNGFFMPRDTSNEASDIAYNKISISLDKMISIVQLLGRKAVSEHPEYYLYWTPGKKSRKKQEVEKLTSYLYMGDTRTNLFHEKKSECVQKIQKEFLRGLGKDPRKVGFTACPICLKSYIPMAITKTPTISVPEKPSTGGQSKAEIMRAQIKALSEQYGMHVEFHGSMAYVTTIAGEWYFDYNDRPIQLRHKNANPRLDRNGKPLGYYHVQHYRFHAPLQVLAYIRNHERLEVERMMGESPSEQT